jgi:hypothetical protein
MEKLWIQGLILTAVLAIIQSELNASRQSFTDYMPPIGISLLIVIMFVVQPILIGVLNIFIINTLYKTKGWQVGFWLNGMFIVLAFSTINLVLQTSLNLSFTSAAVIDIALLALPFGIIARFSNGGWKKPLN